MATKIEVEIPVERQKAAQAAGNFELTDLPGPLSEPQAAVRVGKTANKDTPLKGVKSLKALTHLKPGQMLANFGRSESKWVSAYAKRRASGAEFHELLSYARQIVGVDEDGTVLICLMGHAGQGPCIPLWVARDDVTLTLQPNDIVVRFDDVSFDW